MPDNSSKIHESARLIDWAGNIEGLIEDIKQGCCEASTGIMQFDIGPKRVEIRLTITDDKDEFLIDHNQG